MRFGVLGPIEVRAGPRGGGVGRGHGRTILAVLLAARGQAVSTTRLIDVLWESSPPASARKTLQGHVSRLRARLRQVADDPVSTTASGYRLDLDDHDLDSLLVEQLVARARDHVTDAPDRAVELFERAEGLWRGPAFGELASHAGVRAEASRLERLRITAAADHVDARLALGRHAELVAELAGTVEREPLDERATAQLMLALARTGRQDMALAAFRRLQADLRDELGVDPGPAVTALHERLLHQDERLLHRDGGPLADDDGRPTARPDRVPGSADTQPADTDRSPASAGATIGGGPAGLPRLLGRDREVDTLTSWLTETRLLTLTGPGGVGKTRLAQEVAHRATPAFDAMVEVGLATVRDPADVGGAMVTALGVQASADRPATSTVVEALGDRDVLLVLDNCEHLLDAVTPLVEALLSRCRRVVVLATSRELLHLPSERIWPVAPLAVPGVGADVDAVVASPAGALFGTRAHAVAPDFVLDDDNAPAVAELCRRLDGMPLAIELAAARTRAMSPADLVARLDERFSVLGGGPRHEGGRHRTLEAVVAWSHDLLPPMEAELFDRLSVFAGPFTLAAAEQVCAGGSVARDEVPGLLGDLVDKSMVVVERDATVRYRLLDTLRDFGARRLARSGAAETLHRAHAGHHVSLARDRGREIRGKGEREAVRALDAAIGDLRTAHAWLVSAGDVDGALALPAALGSYAFFRLRDEVTTWAHRALSLDDAAGHPVTAAALATAAIGATSRDDCDRAREQARAALDLTDDDAVVTLAVTALGTAALYEGELDEVLATAQRLASVTTGSRDAYHLTYAAVLRVLGHLYRGEQRTAVAHVADLQRVAAESGNPTMQAFAHYCHGEVHLDVDPDAAAASLAEATTLARSVDNRLIEGVSLVSLASLQARRGQSDAALARFHQVIGLWRRLGDHTHQLTTLRNLVGLLADVGADRAAAELHGCVTAAETPSFGVEARRLQAAWRTIQRHLGPETAEATAARGRLLDIPRAADRALDHVAGLLDDGPIVTEGTTRP